MADAYEDGEILLGCWDCASCGARRLRGDAYQCGSCGAPRPEDVRFYLPNEADVILDEEAIRAAEAGPDWQCAFCESWMPAADAVCRNCQAPLADSRRRQKTRTYDAGEVSRTSQGPTSQGLVQQREASTQHGMQRGVDPLHRSGAPRRRLPIVPLLMVMALVAIAAVVYGVNLAGRRRAYQQELADHQSLVAAAQQKCGEAEAKLNDAARHADRAEQAVARARRAVATEKQTLDELQATRESVANATAVNVVAHAWTVQLQIEQCGAKEGEGWNHPPDAFDVRSEQRVHHHEKVLDRVETLFRAETYRAQDGFDTETYTERVSAGTEQVQDGYEIEDLGNGRFRKTPKFRTETIYRDVTRTRQKPRMVTKTRQIPYENKVYRQDPVRKPWYTYRTKIWTPAPAMSREGAGLDVLDPEGRPPQDPGSELGARRVRDRQVSYTLSLQPVAGDGPPLSVDVPEARWRAFADGSTGLLARHEAMTEAEQHTRLASLRAQIDRTMKQIVALEARVPPLARQIDPLRELLPPLRQALATHQADLSVRQRALKAVVARGY